MPHPDHDTAVRHARYRAPDAPPCWCPACTRDRTAQADATAVAAVLASEGYAGALDLAAALIERTTRHLRARTLRADVARDIAALRRMLVAGEDGHATELTTAPAARESRS